MMERKNREWKCNGKRKRGGNASHGIDIAPVEIFILMPLDLSHAEIR